MLKIKPHLSVAISFFFAAVFGTIMLLLLVTMPFLIGTYLDALSSVLCDMRGQVIAFCYSAVIPVFIADLMLIFLLGKVKKKEIFSTASVGLLRGISWCCFVEFTVMIIFSFIFPFPYSPITLVIGFIAVFLGIVLRVVKNVIEEACVIKEENDFTI